MEDKERVRHGCFPMCFACKQLNIEIADKSHKPVCAAFPNRIPFEILNCEFDHRYPHPDDNGIQFLKVESIRETSSLLTTDSMEVLNEALEQTFHGLEADRRRGLALPPLENGAYDE